MVRAAIAKTTPGGAYPTAFTTLTFTTGVPADDHEVTMDSQDLLVIHNASADTAHTVTVKSVADPTYGRTKDVTESIPFGEYRIFGPTNKVGWANAGKLQVDVDHADLKLAVIKIKA